MNRHVTTYQITCYITDKKHSPGTARKLPYSRSGFSISSESYHRKQISAHLFEKVKIVGRIGWIMTVLIALGWLAYDWPMQTTTAEAHTVVQSCWRRTASGWENTSQWHFYGGNRPVDFHPCYIGLALCFSGLWIGMSCYVVENWEENEGEKNKTCHSKTELEKIEAITK
jgi:hypothetical protein